MFTCFGQAIASDRTREFAVGLHLRAGAYVRKKRKKKTQKTQKTTRKTDNLRTLYIYVYVKQQVSHTCIHESFCQRHRPNFWRARASENAGPTNTTPEQYERLFVCNLFFFFLSPFDFYMGKIGRKRVVTLHTILYVACFFFFFFDVFFYLFSSFEYFRAAGSRCITVRTRPDVEKFQKIS